MKQTRVEDQAGPGAQLPRAGELVAGRFRIVERLGEGGMGVVYLAEHEPLGREVALKVIHPHRTKSRTRARFLREARVAARLNHPGVVRVYDFGEDEHGRLFLAMERLRGPSLREQVDYDLPLLPLARVLEIATQVAEMLAVAERQGVVHRDLKPENIHLEPGEDDGLRVVVVDFGLAFLDDPDEAADGRQTRDGVVSGTPQYLSPEQARGEACTPATDIYSFGIVLYEMLSGLVPFEGDIGTLIARQIYMAPRPLREAAAERSVPGVLDDLVMAMLRKDAAKRPSAAHVREVLAEIELDAPARQGVRHSDAPRTGRAARMISIGGDPESVRPPPTGAVVGWVDLSGLDDAAQGDPASELDLATALSLHGLELRRLAPDAVMALPDDLAALVLIGAQAEDLAQPGLGDIPLFSDARPGEIERLAMLLRAGADEVLVRPILPDDLARKVTRALRKRTRRS